MTVAGSGVCPAPPPAPVHKIPARGMPRRAGHARPAGQGPEPPGGHGRGRAHRWTAGQPRSAVAAARRWRRSPGRRPVSSRATRCRGRRSSPDTDPTRPDQGAALRDGRRHRASARRLGRHLPDERQGTTRAAGRSRPADTAHGPPRRSGVRQRGLIGAVAGPLALTPRPREGGLGGPRRRGRGITASQPQSDNLSPAPAGKLSRGIQEVCVKPSDVKAGECYRTANNWVRQVENIEEGKVRYRSRGTQDQAGWTTSGLVQFQKLSLFAYDVVEAVPSNWEP